ncbi:type II secretion system protein GspD [Botrimarina hoheduenensis]|uniref:Outer membrane porin HofQ n=1 Tax=Botrimarina hoheduenensis TaxID=2528000 RepID=A0A5C5WCN7_9BACT|nr:general secretion pathway protein GspD [Botrimarina hoheduenensis]TWT48440.1 outer membrane porin HofQ [Botrimarina hoheduenensis]
MNATRKNALVLMALAATLEIGLVTAEAQSQAAPPQELTTEQSQLNRQAVDATLNAARRAMAGGDLAAAERLLTRCEQAGIRYPMIHMGDTPAKARRDLDRLKAAQGPLPTPQPAAAGKPMPKPMPTPNSGVTTAAAQTAIGAASGVSNALHVPENDDTSNQPVVAYADTGYGGPRLAQLPAPSEVLPIGAPSALKLLAEGEQALRDRDLAAAAEKFRAANTRRAELPVSAASRLDAHLRMLSAEGGTPPAAAEPLAESSMLDATNADQRVVASQLATALGQAQVESRRVRETEPRRSLEILEQAKQQIGSSGLPQTTRDQLNRRIDRSIAETQKYIDENRAEIELDEQNAAVMADIERDNKLEQELEDRIATHVEDYNTLVDEHRYAEAEAVAKRLFELAPERAIAKQIMTNAKFLRRTMMNEEMLALRDEGNWAMGHDIERSANPNVFDGKEMVYGDNWVEMQKRSSLSESKTLSPREVEIYKKLRDTDVQLRYEDRPLAEVLDRLSTLAGVNIHLDPRGLAQEGVSSDTPVSVNLSSEVSLRSALNLILEPLNLGFTIRDEVLKVTSQTLRDGDLKTETYYVADLVIPIPNFVPSNNIGLQGLINDALAAAPYGSGGVMGGGPIALANQRQAGMPMAGGSNNPDVMAQAFSPGAGGPSASTPLSTGPGGLGGAAAADFDSLIDLIVSTVASDTWAENGGGTAEIRPFPTNLSLVVSQTQAVHEQIADLLEQLRRLQDLQVTIEVRFIRLSDDFFERIGIDFDMNINDNTVGTDDLAVGAAFETPRRGSVVGAQAPLAGDLATVTADLDVPFRQGSFDVALPTFGGFNPTQAATFGFAILSDIEAYFLINAAQGDSRTNVLNAPKVTLFNGQQAFVSDTSQVPFVISVIPVVGEFAAAQQPVIVVLSEGTLMSIQAVVSDDRRYVRLTVVPFFSEIGDVDTFTFDGQTTTNRSSTSSSTDTDDDGTNESEGNSSDQGTIIAGTTVQLPTFQFVSVVTTVSVPDGGTVLLGGIKRLNEGREEFGIPLLSKVPYINRLFRNVGIGRETDSLMMMVTPRIIIQEEEEQRLGLATP